MFLTFFLFFLVFLTLFGCFNVAGDNFSFFVPIYIASVILSFRCSWRYFVILVFLTFLFFLLFLTFFLFVMFLVLFCPFVFVHIKIEKKTISSNLYQPVTCPRTQCTRKNRRTDERTAELLLYIFPKLCLCLLC